MESNKAQNDYYRDLANQNKVTLNPVSWFKEAYYRAKSNPRLLGEPETRMITGIAPAEGPAKVAKSAKEALAIVKAMKAKKASLVVKKTVELPKDLASANLTKSGRANLQGIIDKLPEAERGPVLETLLKKEDFWRQYGNGMDNVTPSKAAGTINAIRRQLGFTGSTYGGLVKYGRQMSGYTLLEDATRYTTGHQRTTGLHPQ